MNKIGWPRSRSLIYLITSMITDRIGQHEVLIPINHNYNKISEILGFFMILKHKKFQVIFLLVGEKEPFKRMSVMVRTVL